MALAAAAFHGTWNVLVKVSGDPILTFRRVTLTTAAVATIPLLPAWWLLGRPASVWIASRLRLYVLGHAIQSPTWRQAALIGAFMWAGYFLVLWALTLAPLAVVAPIRETAVVAVAVWGVWRLREQGRAALKLTGAVATLAGIALLAA